MKNFIVYKSSAGSGKTYTLVKEYLKLALCDDKKLHYNYKFILAVTFTNKAAAEMKSRVISALNKISLSQYSELSESLCVDLKILPDELTNRSKLLLSYILHHYSDFAIGTIDSFTHKIVKTFAHDLKLPINFNIEFDTDSFYEKVVSELFNQIGEDEYVSKLLKEYALNKAEDNSGWDPENQIKEFSKLLLKEDSNDYITSLKKFNSDELEKFRKQFIDFTFHYKNTLKTEGQKAIDLIKKNNLEDNDFKGKKSGPQNFFKKCIINLVGIKDTEGVNLNAAIEKNQWSGGIPETKKIVDDITPLLNEYAKYLISFIIENFTYFSLCELLSKQMYPLMLLKKIEEISLEKKQEEHLVFISEFNQKIFNIINNESTPFIYERLGERYHHYLIDEFQDTSSLQWQNILPLVDNSLANGWFNLIVGDGKQSIYRWRNANIEQFDILPKIKNPQNNPQINERELSLDRNFEEKFLDANYRSSKTIVTFNNSLFDYLKKEILSDNLKNIYYNQAQVIKNQNPGFVSIHIQKLEKDSLNSENFNIILGQINSAIKDGFNNKDICILVRNNTHGNSTANFLIKNGIPVVSSDSLLLKNNFEINTIICYLNYLVNPQDIISGASVINYLYQSNQIDEILFNQQLDLISKKHSLFSILKNCGLEINKSNLSINNLLDNCIEIINVLGLNKNGYTYMRFFLDEVNEFLVTKNSNISSFFEWWDYRSKKASMIIPESTDAVKIMTIHASKGLEFPVVIIPFCNWATYHSNDSWVSINNDKVELPSTIVNLSQKAANSGFEKEYLKEFDEQCLDNLNLLYVAFTRAIERLHIIASSSKGNTQKSVCDWLKIYLNENYKSVSPDYYEIETALPKYSLEKENNLSTFTLKPLEFDTPPNIIQIKPSYLNNNHEIENAKKQGILIHWLLSKIKDKSQVKTALQLALLEGILVENEKDKLEKLIIELIEHPELNLYFLPNVNCKLESEIITATGELLRPDRIVFNSNETIIIDYKTGKENNSLYFKQLINYQNALIEMGYKNIKKILVYTDNLTVVTQQ